MTAQPQPVSAPSVVKPAVAEPAGAIRLRLSALGIDHRAADFPTRFVEFCERNDSYEMEVSAAGELLILPMTGFRGSQQEGFLNYFLTGWRIANGGASAPESSRFHLPSGEIRGPDAAWITQQHYDALPQEQRDTIIEGAPDFVVEIRSRTDDLPPLQRKMDLWMAGGARLGWLIDTRNRQVHIYRAGQTEPQVIDNPKTLDGEDVLPGFSFPVRQYIFDLP